MRHIKNTIKSKRYQTRIYLWVTFLIVVTMVLLTVSIYMNVEKSVLNKEDESNQLILSQMKFNIDFMDEMIRNICISTYYDENVKTLMNSAEPETYEDMKTINQLSNTIVLSNPYILSVYVYNNRKQVYYSTFPTFKYNDVDLIQLIDSYDEVPKLRPIVRKTMTYNVGNLQRYSNVITYFMYEMTDANNNMNGAVVVNIKLDWLIDNIRNINAIDEERQDQVFILDNKGEFFDKGVGQNTQDIPFRTALKDAYEERSIENSAKDADFFKARILGKDYIISTVKLKQTNWVILKSQPYDMVFEYFNKLKVTIILITGIILVLILGAAYSISRGLYKPVEKLMKNVRVNKSDMPSSETYKDEFAYLNYAYQYSTEQLEKFSTERNDNIESIKLYFLRKLLLHSFSISDGAFDNNKQECNVQLSIDKPFMVIILRIDNYKHFQENNDLKTKEKVESTLISAISDSLSKSFINEAVEMEDNEIAVIINVSNDSEETYSTLAAILKNTQASMSDTCNVTFTAAISETTSDIKELTSIYNHAVDYSRYRFIVGLNSIIIPDTIKKNLAFKQLDYNYKYEKQLCEDLKRSDMEAIKSSLSEGMEEMKRLDYNDIMFSLTHLINIIRNTVYELNQSRKDPVNINTLLSSCDISEFETIDQFHAELLDVLQLISGQLKNEMVTEKRDSKIAEAIKDMIDTKYPDYNLCASGIADIMNISSSKISKAFKENFGMSITEYINEVRLAKAIEWIENSKLSIGEIMHKIGFENESYFYRAFKAKFGTTPREYKMKKLFKQY